MKEDKTNFIERTEVPESSEKSRENTFSDEEKTAALEQLEEILARFEEISKNRDPEKWYRPMAKEFIKLTKSINSYHPLVRRFFYEIGVATLDAFHEELLYNQSENHEKIIDVVLAIRNFADKLQTGTTKEKLDYETVSLDQLQSGGRIELLNLPDGQKFLRIQLENGGTKEILVPKEGILYKGGVARLAAKAFFNTSLKGETASDIDIVVQKKNDEQITQVLEKYKVANLTDAEIVHELDIGRILATRDVDMNAALLSKDGLHISNRAKTALQTRIIHPLLPEEREIFGKSIFNVGGIELTKNVLLYRLVRMVVDEKADAFEIKEADTQVPLGIYWLILAKNFLYKSAAGERTKSIEKLFAIAKEMGQSYGATNPIDWLNKLKAEYPDFEIKDSKLSSADYLRWLFGKYLKLLRQKFKGASSIRSDDFEIKKLKTASRIIKVPKTIRREFSLTEEQIDEFLKLL